jgi:hypothetical protein
MALSSLSVVSNTIKTSENVKIIIPNKFLYYNMEQSPPTDQYGSNGTEVLGSCISTTRFKYGSQSAFSNASAPSSIYLRTTSTSLSVPANAGISFSMWFFITGLIQFSHCKIFEAGGNDKYFIRIPANTSNMTFCDRGGSVSFTRNVWNHVVCTIDSTNNGTVYLNGTLGVTFTDPNRYTSSLGQVFICRSTNGNQNSINGFIDDFRIYSKVLTLEEVNAIYTNNDL